MIPFASNIYWFATQYLLLYIIAPILNICIKELDKKLHFLLIIVGGVLFSIEQSIVFWNYGVYTTGYNLIWFIYIYDRSIYT